MRKSTSVQAQVDELTVYQDHCCKSNQLNVGIYSFTNLLTVTVQQLATGSAQRQIPQDNCTIVQDHKLLQKIEIVLDKDAFLLIHKATFV